MAEAQGVQEEAQLRQAGFGDEEIQTWKAQTVKQLSDAGFSSQEIDDHFGVKNPDMKPMKDYLSENLKKYREQNVALKAADSINEPMLPAPDKPGKHEAESFAEAIEAGYQMSVVGLLKRQKNPDTILPKDASMAYKIASQVGTLAGDMPSMIAGTMLGGEAGGAVGAATGGLIGGFAAPGIGAIPGVAAGGAAGMAIGGGYGAFALPAAIRSMLMQQYEKGDMHDFEDFWSRSAAAFIEANKAGAVGAATSAVGGSVGLGLAKTALAPAAQTTAKLMSEIATMTTVGKAIEGEVPTASDFLEAAIMVGGMHLASAVPGKLREIYAKTGVKPEEVWDHAQKDPIIRQDVLSNNPELPRAYEGLVEIPKQEPLPGPDGAKVAKPKLIKIEEPGFFGEKVKNELKVEPMPEPEKPAAPPAERTEAEQKILGQIGSRTKEKAKLTFNEVYRNTIDDLHPLKVFTEMAAGEKLNTKEDPYVMARLTRGGMGRGDRFIEHGPVDFNTLEATGAKGLGDIFKPFKDDLDGWRTYAVAKRAIEKAGQGVETGIDLKAAKEVVKNGGAKYEKSLQEVQQYRDGLIKYMQDSGVLNAEQVARFKEMNQDYVPFYRLTEDAPSGVSQKGFSVRNPIKAMKGSSLKLVDPVESLIKDTYTFIQTAERNRVAKNLVELAESNPEASKGLVEKVPTPMKAIEVTEPEVAKFMAEHGIEGDAAAFTIFRPDSKTLGKNEISLYRNGKREVWTLAPELAEAMKSMDAGSSNLVVKMASKFSGALRTGTTLSPDFALRNIFRDQLSAFVNSRSGYLPWVDAIRGMGSLLKEDAHYQEWLSSGGGNSAFINIDRSYINDHIMELQSDKGLMSKTWNVVKTPVEALKVMSELLENSTRLGEYKRARAGGMDPFAAGFEAREVTLDFARSGAKTRAVNSVIAFWNAQLQGKDRTVRAFQDNPVGTSIKMAASVTIPSVLLWWANKDDPRMEDVPNWQKDLFWIVPTDKWEELKPGAIAPPERYTKVIDGKTYVNNGVIYRLPKPQETGPLFGSLPERVLEAYFKDNPDAMQGFSKTMMKTVDMEYLPNILTPVLEHINNRSFFTGNRIVSAPLEKVLPEYQYTEYTSETAKQLGKIIAAVPGMKENSVASPAIIENYIRGWTGTTGMYALKIADEGLVKSGVIPDPIKPASTLADIPFIKAFVIRNPSASAQPIQNFLDKYESVAKRLESVKMQMGRGKFDDAQKELDTAMAEGQVVKLGGAKEAIGNMQKLIQRVSQNPDMKPEEKRQLIDGVYYQMSEVAKSSNQTLIEVEKSLRKK